MGQITDRDRDWLRWMNAGQMCIGCSCVEIIGDGSPSMIKVQINGARGVVGVKDDSS